MEGRDQSKIRDRIYAEVAWWRNSGDDQWKAWSYKSKARGKKRREIVRFEGSDDGDGKRSTKTHEEGSEYDDDDYQTLEKASEDKGQGDMFGDWLFRQQEYTTESSIPKVSSGYTATVGIIPTDAFGRY
jgi:hypothetical protein